MHAGKEPNIKDPDHQVQKQMCLYCETCRAKSRLCSSRAVALVKCPRWPPCHAMQGAAKAYAKEVRRSADQTS